MSRQHSGASSDWLENAGPSGPPVGRAGRAMPHASTNRSAVAALAIGVLALVSSVVVVGGALGLLGLVVSVVALQSAGPRDPGRRLARIGFVTSTAAILISVAVMIAAVWFAHKTQDCYQFNQVHRWAHCVHNQFRHR